MSNPGQISNLADPNAEVFIPNGWGAPKPTRVLDLPSGGKVRIRELEIPDLLKLGVLDVVDTFTKKVLPKTPGKKAKAATEDKLAEKLMRNPDQLDSMLVVVDKICVEAIVYPEVSLKPEDPAEALDPNKFYAHLIPFEDRMEVFAKSSSSLEEYFQAGGEQADAVGAVEESASVQLPSE